MVVKIMGLRKGYQGAGRMLFSMGGGEQRKKKKGAGRLNRVREQGAG